MATKTLYTTFPFFHALPKKMMTSTTTQLSECITLGQLADHNTLQSLWIAVHGRVYDLTTFCSDHPGGIEVLESSAGTDGTEAYEYAGHSEENMAKMQQYHVGTLAGSLERPPPLTMEKTHTRSAPSARKQLMLPGKKLVVTTLTMALVVALSYRFLSSTLQRSQRQFTTLPGSNTTNAFWAGVVFASSVSLMIFRYFYGLFMSSLDYQNDVFSFPPTIPRKTRR